MGNRLLACFSNLVFSLCISPLRAHTNTHTHTHTACVWVSLGMLACVCALACRYLCVCVCVLWETEREMRTIRTWMSLWDTNSVSLYSSSLTFLVSPLIPSDIFIFFLKSALLFLPFVLSLSSCPLYLIIWYSLYHPLVFFSFVFTLDSLIIQLTLITLV